MPVSFALPPLPVCPPLSYAGRSASGPLSRSISGRTPHGYKDAQTPAMLWDSTPTPHMDYGTPWVFTPADPALVPQFELYTPPFLPTPFCPHFSEQACVTDYVDAARHTARDFGGDTTLGVEFEIAAFKPPLSHPIDKVDLGEFPSIGSALHGAATCNPCAWIWKSRGCKAGVSCNFCHSCPEDEMKNRKKAKVTALRSAERYAAGHSRPCGWKFR